MKLSAIPLWVVCVLALVVTGCTQQRASPAESTPGQAQPQRPIHYEIIAEGAPFVGPQNGKALTLVLVGNELQRAAQEKLPDDAHEALRLASDADAKDLWVVIYAGEQPSSGYAVRITSITQTTADSTPHWTVTYTLDAPGAGQGAASVLTHPFIIARIADAGAEAANVRFEAVVVK